ncbi:MAG: zinc ABC transporter substrate-binding protein [Hydrococcus sp. Prado102]|jgi:manganese/iron transport system substrate-binding protein|nr:zinc ABC transporter substrate-binding protein [Hydrococcus sp. Prado102]
MLSTLRQTWSKATLALAIGCLVGCGQSAPTAQTNSETTPEGDRLRVVATTSVLCDLTEQIAADTIDLTCLLKPGVDAHVYEPVPEDRKAIENAQLILYSGYNLEPDLIKVIKATSNPAPKIAVAEVAVTKPILGEEHEHAHEGEHEGEEHEHEKEAEGEQVPDPHVWHDAQNGIRMAGVIQTNLAQLAPANAELYTKNAQALKEELTKIDSWIKAQIATIPEANRKIVTTHDAMGYYAAAYGIPVEGAIQGISTEEQPTATRVKELVDSVKATKVPTIFAEIVVNPKLIGTVAKESQVTLSQRELFSDSLGEPGSEGDTYPKMLIANTQTIVEGLGGKFTPFK